MTIKKGSKNKKKAVSPKLKILPFTISLKLGNKTYDSTGATMYDALIALQKPDKIMGKGIITAMHGELKHEQLMYPVRLKRLFFNKTFQAIQAKNLCIGLK